MTKLVLLLAFISSPAIADMKTAPIQKGPMAGSVILYQDQRKGYKCGILVDKQGKIRHFVTTKQALADLDPKEVEPPSPDITKDVYNSQWLNTNYWPKCPILTDGLRRES